METTRRSIMGILGGAVAAGPALAEKIVSEVASAEAMIAPSNMMFANTLSDKVNSIPTEGSDWGYGRVRRIKELLRGGDDALAENRIWDPERTPDDLCLESLKSVSAVNKHRIRREHERRRYIQERRRELTEELAQLLTGGWSKRFGQSENKRFY